MKLYFEQLLTHEGWKQQCIVFIENGIITNIVPNTNKSGTLVSDEYALGLPGFVDIQVNGGGGVLFNQALNAQALDRIFAAHRAYGTTSMLPTLITDTADNMQQAATAIAHARQSNCGISGVHFEGPWLSLPKKGVHSANLIRQASARELDILRQSGLGKVMVTVAPETVLPQVIRELVDDDIIVFLGHSNASCEQVNQALDAGASGFTHLFNAMSGMSARTPGMVGAALANDTSYAGLIVDGHHVAATSCKAAINAKGIDHIALVTDAMALAASNEHSMPFFEHTIVKNNNKLTIEDGTLAGSCLTMIDAFNNVQKMCSVDTYSASVMASLTPARAIGLEQKIGSLAVGKKADIVALDAQSKIASVWQNGNLAPMLQA